MVECNLAMVDSGAPGRCGFDEADLALVCASNRSELGKTRDTAGEPEVPRHPYIRPGVDRDWIRQASYLSMACDSATRSLLNLPTTTPSKEATTVPHQTEHVLGLVCSALWPGMSGWWRVAITSVPR